MSLKEVDSNSFFPCASSHSLRYVMRNRKTDEPLLVVVFTLVPKEQLEESGGQIDQEKLAAQGQGADEGVD